MFQYIYQQPEPFEKFVYDSLVRKRSSLRAELVFCHHTSIPKIWVVADLYSQLDPPLLSGHTLRKNANPGDKFIADIMQQVDLNISYYKYNLNSCHIRRTSCARQRLIIGQKLRELKKWQRSGGELSTSDREWIDNTIAVDYSISRRQEKKVYLGFTTYAYNSATDCKEKLGRTIFSSAIYDSSDCFTTTSCRGSTAGGSTHILKTNDCLRFAPGHRVHLLLTDAEQSWRAETMGDLKSDGIHFVAPPYTGNWDISDGNRLIDVNILGTKCVLKFVYV